MRPLRISIFHTNDMHGRLEAICRLSSFARRLRAEAEGRLAHTDAECIREFGYLVLEEEQTTEYEVPTIVRGVMEDYIQRHSPVPMPETGRWVRVGGRL